MKNERKKKEKPKDHPDQFVIVCAERACKAEITGAYNVVRIKETNHHLVDDDDEIMHRICRKDDAETDEVFCAKCKVNKLGIEINYQKGCFYRGSWVALSAEGVKYIDLRRKEKGDERAQPPFKFYWKNAPFEIKTDSYSVEIPEGFDYELDE